MGRLYYANMKHFPLIFMGSPQGAVTILDALLEAGYPISVVVTQPDKPAGRGQKLSPPPVKIFAEAQGLKVLQPLQVKTPEFAEQLKSFNAKALIVAAYGRILSQEILDITPSPLNVHFSLLPKYRGASCVASAILNDEGESGVTIMRVVEELDAGPILKQESLKISEDDTTGSLETKLAQMGGKLLVETLQEIQEGKVKAKEQDPLQAIYAPLLKKEDAHLDWNKNSRVLFNQIRAFNPWPISFTYIDKKRLKIYGGQQVETRDLASLQTPGTPINLTDEGIEVACGEGTILLTEVQPEGKNKMSAKDFLNGVGRTLKIGQTLG